MKTVGPEALNSLRVALAQNQWIEDILGRFDEIALLAFAPAAFGALRDIASGYVWSFVL